MSELVELKRKEFGQGRRWFSAPELDLIVFFTAEGEIKEFQFCYDKNVHEQMLGWKQKGGYTHMAIDDGDDIPDMGHKRSPVIVPNGAYNVQSIFQKLDAVSAQLPEEISLFVSEKIQQHPDFPK